VDFGVYVHGAAVNALLQGRPLIRASLMVELLSLTVCALLGAGAALVVGRRRGLWRWTLPLPLAAALGAAVGVAVVLFAEQVLSLTTLIAVVLVALVGSTFVLSAYGQSRSRRRPLSLDTGASL
jgi:CHASE2 domain-containing sensor protein